MADLFNPLASLTNDRASQLSVGYSEENERGGEETKTKHAEKHFRQWVYQIPQSVIVRAAYTVVGSYLLP